MKIFTLYNGMDAAQWYHVLERTTVIRFIILENIFLTKKMKCMWKKIIVKILIVLFFSASYVHEI